MSLLTPLVDGGLTETQPHSIIIVNLVGSKHSQYFIAKMVLLFCKKFARIPNQQCMHTFTHLCKLKIVSSLLRLEKYMYLILNGFMEAEWTTVCAYYHLQTTFISLITIDLCILFYIVLIPLHLKLIFVKHSLVQNNIS